MRRPGLGLTRSNYLDQPLAVILRLPPEGVEPGLRLSHDSRLVLSNSQLAVVHEAAVGEVGRACDHTLAAEEVGLAVQKALEVAADLHGVAAQQTGQPQHLLGGLAREGQRVALVGKLTLEILEPAPGLE